MLGSNPGSQCSYSDSFDSMALSLMGRRAGVKPYFWFLSRQNWTRLVLDQKNGQDWVWGGRESWQSAASA
jgi:hypothetical protein